MTIDGNKTIVLVTGANRGIGYETVKALLTTTPSGSNSNGAPYHVFLGARNIEKGKKAASSLSVEHGSSVSAVQLETTSADSIHSAVSTIKSEAGRIDILVNNAGIVSEEKDRLANLRQSLDVNVTATFAVSEAFKDLLVTQPTQNKKSKRIINVTSDLGSITSRYDAGFPNYVLPYAEYRTSKAALNMLTACQSWELKEHDVKAFAFNPGYTVTELSGPVETRREQGAWEADVPGRGCAKIIAGERDQDVGHMVEVNGVAPW